MTVRTVISGWSAISPYGLTTADFAAGVRTGPGGGEVPGFSAREVLGIKGTRAMDRQAALAVAATGQLLTGPDGEPLTGTGVGLVLGTTTASAQSMMDFVRDSLTKKLPFYVDPARFPNTVLNVAAARCAIWHQLTGPNATVSAGRATALQALGYARRLHRAGRADTVLCGAVEELSEARRWLEAGAEPLGEGCAVLLLEPAGRPAEAGRTELAELLAVESAMFHAPGDAAAALTRCVRTACAAAGEAPEKLWAVARSGGPDPVGAAEAAALADLVGDQPPVRLCAADLVGDTAAASAAFALVAVLANAAGNAEAAGRTALVTAVDADGVVAAALLRIGTVPANQGAR